MISHTRTTTNLSTQRKQKQILMTKHMLCLFCVVMTLLNARDSERRVQAIQCALSFEALSHQRPNRQKF